MFWKKKPKRTKAALPRPHPVHKSKSVSRTIPSKPKPVIHTKTGVNKKVLHNQPKSDFLKVFKQLTYRHRAWDVWRDFIVMFACTLSNPFDKNNYDVREERYLRTIGRYTKQEQEIFPKLVAYTVMAMEENSEQDFLGDIFMELHLGNGANGQFFTPYHVCQLMASVSMGDNVLKQVKEKGYITIHDPCCGAGATLIAGIHEAKRQLEKENLNYQNHVYVTAQDIDETVALMCYIQLSLLGVTAYVKVGNALTDPITANDTVKNYWFTPMYFSDIWQTRRLIHHIVELLKGESDSD